MRVDADVTAKRSKRRTLQGLRAFVTESLRYGAAQRLSTCRWERPGRRARLGSGGHGSGGAGPARPRSLGGARGLYDLIEEREDRFQLERVAEGGTAGGLEKGLRARVRQIAGREDEAAGHVRLDLAQTLVQPLPVEARHLEVGQDGVVVVRGRQLERLLAVAGGVHLVTDGLEKLRQKLDQDQLVVHDQKPHRFLRPGGLLTFVVALLPGAVVLEERQVDVDRGPLADDTLGAHRSLVLLDDGARHAQPQTGPL